MLWINKNKIHTNTSSFSVPLPLCQKPLSISPEALISSLNQLTTMQMISRNMVTPLSQNTCLLFLLLENRIFLASLPYARSVVVTNWNICNCGWISVNKVLMQRKQCWVRKKEKDFIENKMKQDNHVGGHCSCQTYMYTI